MRPSTYAPTLAAARRHGSLRGTIASKSISGAFEHVLPHRLQAGRATSPCRSAEAMFRLSSLPRRLGSLGTMHDLTCAKVRLCRATTQHMIPLGSLGLQFAGDKCTPAEHQARFVDRHPRVCPTIWARLLRVALRGTASSRVWSTQASAIAATLHGLGKLGSARLFARGVAWCCAGMLCRCGEEVRCGRHHDKRQR